MGLLKKTFKFIMSRFFIISMLILMQITILAYTIWRLGSGGFYFYYFFNILSFIVAFSIVNREFNPAYKVSWMLFVLSIPFAGVSFYLLFGRAKMSKKRKEKLHHKHNVSSRLLKQDTKVYDEITNEQIIKTSRYITNTTGGPIFKNTKTLFLSPGEKMYQKLLEQLEEAEKFIFLEYFIIEKGRMWDGIYEILKRKVSEGVEVRIIYDDFGCINRLSKSFKKDLIALGIKVINYNPYRPRLSMFMNYRDHRKLAIIDGNIAFTGGINIADEYINEKERFGYWKDSAVMIEGEAVWSLTVSFLQMWNYEEDSIIDYEKYRPTKFAQNDGYVQPFADGPLYSHLSTENTYINIINSATKYVYITTPYLIIDNEIMTALKNAAISGVDVRIITPGIPDKKTVFIVTQSYYRELILAGVKIYEYLPGFLHSKSIVSDGIAGMVGSANLDYRSLYLHYEVSCFMYLSQAVRDLEKNCLKIIDNSKQITFEEYQKIPLWKKVLAFFLRALSPLM